MKNKLLLSVSLLSGMAFGQSFTSANEPAIGATQAMFQCDSSAVNFANTTGSGVTWDYSNISKINNANRTYSIIANPNMADFTTSNKVIEISNTLNTYLETDATSKSINGFEYITGGTLGTIKINFDADKLNLMNYDFKLNDEISDIFSGTLTYTGGTAAASGTSISKVDGMGTLMLSPTVSKSNVLRHHMIDSISSTVEFFPGVGIPFTFIFNQFDYYDFTGDNLPLFTHLNITILQSGTSVSNTNFVLNSVEPQSTVSLDEKVSTNFTIYPNPIENELHISGITLSAQDHIQIVNLAGRQVARFQANEIIHVDQLNSGVYFIEIENNGNVLREKFVKK